jgi:hypothetical protein
MRSYTEPGDYQIGVNFDYVNRTTDMTLIDAVPGTSHLTGSIGHIGRLLNGVGTTIQTISLAAANMSAVDSTGYYGQGMFGLSVDGDILNGGADRSSDTGSVYIDYYPWHWEASTMSSGDYVSGGIPLASIAYDVFTGASAVIEAALTSNANIHWDTRGGETTSDYYSGFPVIVERGDSAVNGFVNTVVNDNQVTLTVSNQVGAANYLAKTVAPAIGKVVSGANLGDVFRVVGQEPTYLEFDIDASALSGQTVSLMPIRDITGSTAFTIESYANQEFNTGGGGPEAKFSLDDFIPNDVGSILLSSSSWTASGVGPSVVGGTSQTIPVQAIDIINDIYSRDVKQGDVVYYSKGEEATSGVVCSVEASPIGGYDTRLNTYPAHHSRSIDASSGVTIYRSNGLCVLSFPELDSTYTTDIRPTLEDASYLSPKAFSSVVTTPSLSSLEVTANEYESTFTTISESTHFHIGAIHLSNGQVINESSVSTSLLPILDVSAVIQGGDPTSLTSYVNTTMHSTQGPSSAHRFAGQYYNNGIATFTTSQVFNAAQTLFCSVTAKFGSIIVNKDLTLPVQPSL